MLSFATSNMQTCSSFSDVTIQSAQWPLERNFLWYLTKAESKLLYIAVPVCIFDVYQKPCCNCPRAPACPKRIRFAKETSPRRQKGLEIPKSLRRQLWLIKTSLLLLLILHSDHSRVDGISCHRVSSSQPTKIHLLQQLSGYQALAPRYPLSLKKRHGLKVLTLPICAQQRVCLLCDQNTHCKGHTWKWVWADCSHHVWAHMRGVITGVNVLSLQDGIHQQLSHVVTLLPDTWPKRRQSPSERENHMPHNLSTPKPGEKEAEIWFRRKLNVWEATVILKAEGRTM